MNRWKKCENSYEDRDRDQQAKIEYLDNSLREVKRLIGVRDSTVGEIRNFIEIAREFNEYRGLRDR